MTSRTSFRQVGNRKAVSMSQRLKPVEIPSLRRWLIGVHRDLFTIDDFIVEDVSVNPLNQAEKMILILEDRRYFTHIGIDYRSVLRELFRKLMLKKHGGASTIDMQFVRTATGYKNFSLKRKIYEMFLSFVIQFRYTKIQIFRSYMRYAFFGSGIRGIDDAAWQLYQKNTDALDLQEAATIAAMLVYPKPLVPTSTWHVNINRRANYAMKLYPRHKQRLEQLPCREEI
ncbi:biosynthetic peptidoglycan transglycosylase [Agrobacterium cavarae]